MLKLISNTELNVSYFDDYEHAVDYLAMNLKNEKERARVLTTEQAIKYFSSLCDKHIECYEKDNGKSRYKVRIRG